MAKIKHSRKESKQEIRDNAKKMLDTDPHLWYKANLGSPDDSDYRAGYWNAKSRAEILAEEIVANGVDKLKDEKAFPKITRTASYRVKSHNGVITNSDSNRFEEQIAKSMYQKTYDGFGRVIDYQVPLKDRQDDQNKGLGKIDLLAYNEKTQILTLLELKKPASDEPLLRAALEIYTYWRIIDQNKLIENYQSEGLLPKTKIKVEKAVLLFENSYAYNEFYGKNKKKSPKSVKLMTKEYLDVKFYGLSLGVSVL